MKKFKRLLFLLLLFAVIALVLSFTIVRRDTYEVGKGFSYGAPQAQTTTAIAGIFTINRYGFPSTYREQHTFVPRGDIFNESTYEAQPFDSLYLITNFIFWLGLFAALLSPLTIFYRPKKKLIETTQNKSQVESTDAEMPSQVKSDEILPPR